MIEFKQFLPDDMITNENVVKTEQIIVDNIRASLAADDDPSNDDSTVTIEYLADRNGTGEPGIYIIGRADGDIQPYPERDREVWEIPGAISDSDKAGK